VVATSHLARGEQIVEAISLMADKSKLWRTLAVVTVPVVVAVLGFSSASLADATNVFAGSWATKAAGSASGTLTLSVVSAADGVSELQGFGGTACAQPTTYYYGNYDNLGSTGVISGCTVSTDHLVGRFRSDSPQAGHSPYGDGDITFVAPNSFSGHLTYEGSSYSYTGTQGAGTPTPSPPPSTPPPTSPPPTPKPTSPPSSSPGGPSATPSTPGGSSPAASTPTGPSSTSSISGTTLSKPLTALPGSGEVMLAEPGPGASATAASPNPLPANAATALVSVIDSLGDFPGTTIVGPGESHTHQSTGTVACWLIGPDAPQIPSDSYGKSIALGFFRGRLHASDAYTACAGVAQSIVAASVAQPTAAASQAQGSGCAARRVEVAITAHNGLITDARPVQSPGPGASGLKYGCQRSADGSLRISIDGRRAGGLRPALGSSIRLGVVRATDAQARNATMRFGFGATWTGTWHTTHGVMHLTQNGGQVSGTYATCGGRATVTGQVTGTSFDGTWTEPCDSHSGRLHFTLAADGQTFKGSWGYGRGAPKMSWNATRG
jgi:hypothetical protein